MREILFRGKGIKDNVWVYGDLLQDKCGHTRIQAQSPLRFSNEVDFSTVGQYTGLTDKNGTKIFEGDVISITLGVEEIKGVVKFDYYNEPNKILKLHLGFYLEFIKQSSYLRKDIGFWFGKSGASIEVKGNIHDNPELVEGKDESISSM